MPASVRLAIGAIGAALLLVGDGTSGAMALAVVLGGAAFAGIGWLLVITGGRRAVGVAIAAVALGAVAIGGRVLVAPSTPPPMLATLPTGEGPWMATVLAVSPLREGTRPTVVGLDAPPGIRLAASLPAWPAVVPGDRVTLAGSIEPRPEGSYGEYLERIGASGVLRARGVEVLPPTSDAGPAMEGLRRGADDALRRSIPEPEAGLASGILLGLRDRVDRALAADFTTVGASHVVAISGWNIAIVAATLGALAGRLARRRRAALTALAIVAYVIFVGASPSVVRAGAMAGVVLLARELGRPSRAAAAIGWAVVALLLADPALVEDTGFRLSAVATAGLICWGTPLTAALSGASPGRVRAWLAESLGVSLAAQLATLPIVALEFGRLSLISPLVNLGVVPLVAPAMAAGAAALTLGGASLAGVPAIVATIGGLPAWALLAGIVAMVRAGAAVPFASLELVAPWDAVVAAASGALMVAGHRWFARRSMLARSAPVDPTASHESARQAPAGRLAPRLATLGLVVALGGLVVAVAHRPDGIARLTVLDVGQGDAILLEGGRGSRLLIDGGPDPGRLVVALDEHLPPWDRRVDVVVLSHPHEDHAAGLAALIGRYGVRRVLEPGMVGPGPGYAALREAMTNGRVDHTVLAAGDLLRLDDIELDVLWPDPGTVPLEPPDTGTAINNVSIVLLGRVGGHSFLLAGDIEEEIDPVLVDRGLPDVDVLKVAHHGSRTASTEPFLAMTRPEVAVVSAGRRNRYGHPSPDTIARLEAAGANVQRTDVDGTVEIELGPGPIRVRVEGARAAAARWAASPPIASITDRSATPLAWLCGIPLPAGAPPRVADAVVERPP